MDLHDSKIHGRESGRGPNLHWLTANREYLAKERINLNSGELAWSWARLITFFAAGTVWYPLSVKLAVSEEIVAGVTAFLFGLFVVSVRRHLFVRDRRELADRIIAVTDESIQRCGGQVVLIRSHDRPKVPTDASVSRPPILDDGPTWRLTAQECMDLDLYASPVGIVGLLNRTSTDIGYRRLCDMVENPSLSIPHIQGRQTAVGWLEEHAAQRLRVLGSIAILRGKDAPLDHLTSAVRGVTALPSRTRYAFLRLWSLASFVFTIIAVVQVIRGELGWTYLWAVLASINASIYARMRHLINDRLERWKRVSVAADGLLHLSRESAAVLPDDGLLGQLRSCFHAVIQRDVLPSLCRRVAWADAGGMVHAFCNAVFFYDLHVVAAILNRAVPHRSALMHSLSALADLEALNSLACFAFESHGEHPVSYPQLSAERIVSIKSGRHPLIPPSRAIPNDVSLDPSMRVCVITGSNMAGKSTYLRMCGVNCLLAQLGTAVLAKRMTLSPMRLITDLQVSDNLAEQESYFLAEVRHLRRMVSPESDSTPMLGLMDEPFRGTNSAEQVAGALAVIDHVHMSQNFFLVATHEQRLADLADQRKAAENRHFSENLGEDGMVFNYVLQPGPATSRNALLVLEREGYPPELLSRARSWLNDSGETPLD